MNLAIRTTKSLVMLIAGLCLTQLASAQLTWTGASGTDLTWTNGLNWDTTVAPIATDNVTFGFSATTNVSTDANNVVDTDQTIATLIYNQTNTGSAQWHVTRIPTGITLTTTTLTVGGLTLNGAINNTAMIGDGTLQVNGSATVGNNAISGNLSGTILDLSGLSSFVFNNSGGNLQISSGARSGADMKFASASNYVRAAGVKLNDASSSGTTSTGTVNLGAGTNVFNVGSLFMTASNRNTGTLQFLGGTGGLRVRGLTGADADPCPVYQVGYRAGFNSTGGGSSAGTNNFFGHPVDMLVNQLTVGRESVGGQTVGGPASTSTGVLNFGPGTIKVTTQIEIGRATSQGPQASAIGVLNISSGTLIYAGTGANSATAGFNLGYDTGTAVTAGTSTAFLNVTNGSVISSNNILRQYATGIGNGNSFINLIRSSMSVAGGGLIGLPAVPINTLTIGDSVLSLAIPLNSTNVNLTTINNVSTTNNTINILSFPTILNYPTTYRLIKYGSGTPGTFVLGSLPVNAPAYQGYLSNNVAIGSIDFVLTNGPAPAVQTLVWNGNINGNWDTTTANWTNSSIYNQNDYVTFSDVASGTTTVNLTTALTPGTGAGLIVNNTTKLYAFGGSGNIAGPTSLTKNGANTLVISNSANNTFGGGVIINGGTVKLGGSDNRLPTSTTVTFANVAGASLDLSDLNQTVAAVAGGGTTGGNIALGTSGANSLTITGSGSYSGVISGNGSVNKSGAGTHTFYGANTYSGGTVVGGGGLLAVANTSGSGTGTGYVSLNSGTLQIGDGFTAGSVASAFITNNGTLQFNSTNNVMFTNQIVGNGALILNANNTVTLPADNSGYIGGNASINSGTLLVTHPNALGAPNNLAIGLNGTPCLALANNISLNTPIQMFCKPTGSGPSMLNLSGTNTLPGGVFLSEGGQNWLVSSAAGRLILSGAWNTGGVGSGSRTLWLSGLGDGEFNSNLGNGFGTASIGLLKDGSGTWTLGGIYTYADTTTVSNGTLLVNGFINNSLTRVRGGTLGGNGSLLNVIVSPSGTIAPGVGGIGTLSVDNLTLNGTAAMELSKVDNVIANDQISAFGTITNGGTLNITLTGTVSGGDVFTLFTAAAYDGTFNSINLPSLPSGLSWDTSNLAVNGTLAIVSAPILNVSQSGNVLTFSWTGSFKLQSQTNALNAGIKVGNTNWFDYPGGGSSPATATIIPENPTEFFRLISP